MYGFKDAGVPWCACFAGYVIAVSAASAEFKQSSAAVMSPSTALLYERAHANGWVERGDSHTPPGSLFVIPGRHVGFVWQAYRDGTFLTIEGNSGDAVRSNRRSWDDGWEAIVLPRTGTTAPTATQSGYGFDDTRVKLYGGWQTREQRDQQMAAFKKSKKGWWTQPVRVKKRAPFAFRAGPDGTFSHNRFGPWVGHEAKARRDDVMRQWQENNKATARPWRDDSIPASGAPAPAKED